jgi:hypothetical protein
MGFFGGGGSSVDLASPPAIGNTTPNTGAFTTLSATPPANTTAFNSTGYSLTGTNAQTLLNLAGTWNTTGTPTGILLNITNTASNTASRLIDLKIGGTTKFAVEALAGSAFTITQYGFTLAGRTDFQDAVGLTSNGEYRIGGDVILARDAANVFAQRRSTNAQTFRLYNTYTDASNYERGFFRWNTNVLEIGAEKAGTGSDREFKILTSVGYATFSGYFLTSNLGATFETVQAGVGTAYSRLDSSGIRTRSSFSIGWVSGTNTAVAADTALSRNAAGVVEVNNGTAGTFRDLIVRNFRMSAPTGVPTANNSTGTEGSIRWDADYIYICTATNTWKRVAIATWP